MYNLIQISSFTLSIKDLVILGGVGAVIDSIANNLCEESDAIIIPGPLYSAFQSDVRASFVVMRLDILVLFLPFNTLTLDT
eukprot:Awhi_evm1s6921